MGVKIQGYPDPTLRTGPGSVKVTRNVVLDRPALGCVKILQPLPLPTWNINVYGRYYSSKVPETFTIDASIDNISYTTSGTIGRSDLSDPLYDLLFTYVGAYTDIWIRPTGANDIMLGDTISQTGTVVGDYPYSYSSPYQYSVHNGIGISDTIDLYFQIAYIF